MQIFLIGVVTVLGAAALFIVAQVFDRAIYNESLPSVVRYYEKQKRKCNIAGLVLLVLGICAVIVTMGAMPETDGNLHRSAKAIAAILLFMALVASIPCAALAFGIYRGSGSCAFFLNLVFAGIALAVAIRFEEFLIPQIWTATLGVIAIALGAWIYGVSYAYAERDVANRNHYISPRPVHERFLRMSPGRFLIAQATACALLGLAILVAQVVGHFSGKCK